LTSTTQSQIAIEQHKSNEYIATSADDNANDVNGVIEEVTEDLLDAVCDNDTLAGGDEPSLEEPDAFRWRFTCCCIRSSD